MQASGTSRFGFSTASEFCAADSMPRKAQSVNEMLEPKPCAMLCPCGFQAAAKVSVLNQNQPKIDSSPTGMITPQTVIEPILPVMDGPPKFAAVVSHSRAITPMQVAMGADESHGMKAERYPTAEIAMATFPIDNETK